MRPILRLTFFALLPAAAAGADAPRDALWAAVRNADVAAVKSALDSGANVNATNEIGISALWIASQKGNAEVIKLLVDRGADVNVRDGIWYQTPLSQSLSNLEVVKILLPAGAKDIDPAVLTAAARGRLTLMKALLEANRASPEALNAALMLVPKDNTDLADILKQAGATPLPNLDEAAKTALKPLAGAFESDGGAKITLQLRDWGLVNGTQVLKQERPNVFVPIGHEGLRYTFEREGATVPRLILRRFTAETHLFRPESKPAATAIAKPPAVGRFNGTPLNWPSFRGPSGTGIADGQAPPITWDVAKGANLAWKTPIPGLGHSCPIVWGDRVFITTAVGEAHPQVRIGNYGDVTSVDDASKHTWHVLCLDRDSGKILWNQTVREGVPKSKRHLKGSQANCTPATDGKRVVTCFGPEGLYCHDFNGKLLWKRDLGNIDSSFAIDREYEWGFAGSPVIHDGLVFLQCDLSKDSFVAAFSLEDGQKVWSTPRDEIPSWSSPIIWKSPTRTELVTNASQFARGYDPATGQELWRIAKKSEATIPAPVAGDDVVFIVSGNRPIQPIIAIKPEAAGDITLKDGESHNAHVRWSRMRGGPYMPTPVLYRGHLYVCSNAGVLTCFDAATGKEIYKERIGGESYTASPVVADGRLYFISEQGQARVVKAGPAFELLAVNDLGEPVLATPAISAGTLFVRGQHAMMALRVQPQAEAP